jgi:hypothetical protein
MESSPSGGDVKQAYDYDKERCDMANRLTVSTELYELKESLAEFPLDPIKPDSKTYKMSIQPKDTLRKQVLFSTEEPSKVAHIGNTLDPK